MADNKKNIKTFEYEEGFPTPQGDKQRKNGIRS